MLLGLSLFWVGAVFFLNGLWVLDKVGDREIAVIDVFVGTLTLGVAIYLAFGPGANAETIKGAAFLLLFTFTYYWVAWNRWNGADGRGLGWFCLFVAITCAPIALQSFATAHTIWAYCLPICSLGWVVRVRCQNRYEPAQLQAAVKMLAMHSSNIRVAHERNERRVHEPKVVRREDLPHDHHHHGHKRGVSPLIRQHFGDVQKSHPH